MDYELGILLQPYPYADLERASYFEQREDEQKRAHESLLQSVRYQVGMHQPRHHNHVNEDADFPKQSGRYLVTGPQLADQLHH